MDGVSARLITRSERGAVTPDTLGLRLGETKDLLCAVQETVIDAQVKAPSRRRRPARTAARRVDTKTPAPSCCAHAPQVGNAVTRLGL